VEARALEHALRALPAQGSLLILATQPSAAHAPAELVAQRLAQLCLRVLSQCSVRAVVATGGDTAKAILEASRTPIIAVQDELMPGVALAAFDLNDLEYQFVTKAGGFGQDNTLVSIRDRLG
jgi:D-threonate/D-erythronate kinase